MTFKWQFLLIVPIVALLTLAGVSSYGPKLRLESRSELSLGCQAAEPELCRLQPSQLLTNAFLP